MRVTFAGVGEAFDETLPNTSLLVEHGGRSLLLDCGLTAAAAFWRAASDPLGLDGVVISHFHGDHFLGLSGLLLRFVEEGREKDFFVVGQAGVEAKVGALMDMAYPGFMAKRRFGLNCLESAPGASLSVAGFDLAFALGDHSLPCLGVLVRADGKSVYYSGDGRPTEATWPWPRGRTWWCMRPSSWNPTCRATAPWTGLWSSRGGPKPRPWPWSTCSGTCAPAKSRPFWPGWPRKSSGPRSCPNPGRDMKFDYNKETTSQNCCILHNPVIYWTQGAKMGIHGH